MTSPSCCDKYTGTALHGGSSRIQSGTGLCSWSPVGLHPPRVQSPPLYTDGRPQPAGTPDTRGSQGSPWDSGSRVSPDGGFGKDPWKGIRPGVSGCPSPSACLPRGHPRALPAWAPSAPPAVPPSPRTEAGWVEAGGVGGTHLPGPGPMGASTALEESPHEVSPTPHTQMLQVWSGPWVLGSDPGLSPSPRPRSSSPTEAPVSPGLSGPSPGGRGAQSLLPHGSPRQRRAMRLGVVLPPPMVPSR